jgi:iduronate 2-sulfatase
MLPDSRKFQLTLVLLALSLLTMETRSAERPNVLLICVDDLRPELGCYGAEHIQSPAIDRLAAEGRRFTRHYVQSAVCGPSRCSLLTGQRYWHWDCWAQQRKAGEEPKQPASLAHHFRRQGYRTVSLGKISHEPGGTMPPEYTVHQVPFSWDRAFCPSGPWENPWRAFFAYDQGQAYNKVIRWTKEEPPRLPLECADVEDTGYADGWIAEAAVQELESLSRKEKPFLLAVGFFKPHLPHNAPKKYWDLYERDAIELPDHRVPAEGIDSKISLHESFELTTHYDWPSGAGVISDDEARRQRHAYFACVSYVDTQIGKVLDACDRLKLDERTIVVLWGDHGWHLFDHGMFGKQTNFEIATRSPLIVRVPGMNQKGEASSALAETVDIYPTLVDLCGLPKVEDLAGESLCAQLEDPGASGQAFAYSFHGRGQLMGRTLRADRYRFVQWRDRKTGEVAQVELYDHDTDPAETKNTAGEHRELVERLNRELEKASYQIRRSPKGA